jgi:hypothetical protein
VEYMWHYLHAPALPLNMLLTIVLWIIVISAVLSVPYLIMGMLGAPTDRYPPWFRSIADRICRYCRW